MASNHVRKRGRRPRSDSSRYPRREKRGSTEREPSQYMTPSSTGTGASNPASLPESSGCMAPPDCRRRTTNSTDGPPANSTEFVESPTDFHTANSPYTTQTQVFNGLFQIPADPKDLGPNQTSLSPGQISRPSSPIHTFHNDTFDDVSSNSNKFPLKQQYRCLDTIAHNLKGILSLEEASDMLEIYFNEESNYPFKSTSPYMLAHVLHPSTISQPTCTRPISPALVVVILFCVTQTADMRIFDTPGARERTSVDLYRLSVDLLQAEDPDNYFRTSDGWQFHPQTTKSPQPDTRSSPDFQPSGKSLLPKQLGSTDIILAVAILTLAISGGHYKADSLKWKDKLIRLVRASGLSMEDQDIDLGPVFCGLYNGDATFRRWLISKEERRRLFWLIYSLDRHLALSFNMRISLPEGTFCVRNPLPETVWQSLDTADLTYMPTCQLGPPTQITGCGFFEYFLPLASLLGHIIDMHHYRSHPNLGKFVPQAAVHQIEAMISQREQELDFLTSQMNGNPTNGSHSHGFSQPTDGLSRMTEKFGTPKSGTSLQSKLHLVHIYSTYLLHVFYILLHGKWDPISMIEDKDDWITSESFLKCASHALSATEVVSRILTLDPEMLFMPYLFGIYLLQGSFILLLFVDRMPELGPNRSVEEVCETIIRAHEVSVVTLDTTFQKGIQIYVI
ncbi:hypothetical protein N7478_005209 [Penicillium angulare]|uniref:uncharacterized protein n=1 Tax=Penicillium angulare TaxID=116970 RepID=UPI002540D211|nr:uncharacterized protein N7478_005209 [Penicillium angulare]KAJ5279837.1 hypothetical protein N7478_005209 [Penicillium angulare]